MITSCCYLEPFFIKTTKLNKEKNFFFFFQENPKNNKNPVKIKIKLDYPFEEQPIKD